jgi:hypothetical protein
MIKKLAMPVAVLLVLLLPSAATAVEPPIQNLAPADGSTIQAVKFQPVQVELACPGYGTGKAGAGYQVMFATSAELNPEGNFATPFFAGSSYARPINAAEDICRAELPLYRSEYLSGPTTFYWRVERTSCPYIPLTADEECEATAKGPIWGFTVVPPAKPATPVPTPAPSTPKPAPIAPSPESSTTEGGRPFRVYIGCGASKSTRASYTCRKNQTIGVFLESPTTTRYTVCVKFPEGGTQCVRNQRAEADTLYVNTIKKHKSGIYTVTWVLEGHHYVRRVHRTL